MYLIVLNYIIILVLNIFHSQDNPQSRGRKFNDDDSETDYGDEDEKRNLDDDEYNKYDSNEEEYDNEGHRFV